MNSTIVEAYYSYQVDMAVIFGADRSFAEKEMMKSLEFEFDLANVKFHWYWLKIWIIFNKYSE